MKNLTLLLVFGLLLIVSKLHAQMELSAMLGYDAMKAEPIFLSKEPYEGYEGGKAAMPMAALRLVWISNSIIESG